MTIFSRSALSGLLALAALFPIAATAQTDCTSEFAAQKLDLTEELRVATNTYRRLAARLGGQQMRLDALAGRPGIDKVPPAPELPKVPEFTLEAAAGCTQTLEAELAEIALVTSALDKIQSELESRETIIAEIERGGTAPEADPALAGTTDASVAETATLPEPVTPPPTASEEGAPSEPAALAPADTAPEQDAPRQAFTPLSVPDAPDLFQRVIALPGLTLFPAPGNIDGGQQLPVFSVLYVFERRDLGAAPWLQVGSSLTEGPQGWVSADQALDWSTMLVMQFTPRGKRNPVLFFENDIPLVDMISSPFYQAESMGLYQTLADERRKLSDDPSHSAQWPVALVAVEPETAVRYDDRPYLLPILDWSRATFDGTVDTTLVKVAAVPSAPSADIGARDEASMTASASDAAMNDDEFRVGVVFVVDTTISMRPFIERTNEAIEEFYRAFSRYETSQYVSFGLVGFRDTTETDEAQLEYVTRVFQPLDPDVPAASVLSNMGQMREATVSNLGFTEDSLAGLVDAINDNDWSPYDARLLILVTDASARMDERSKYPDMTLERLRETARSQNITIIPIHLQTPANASEDRAVAREQYRVLSDTGDLADDKYIALDATTDEDFARELTAMAEKIASQVMVANSGELVRSEAMEPVPELMPEPAAPVVAGEGRLAEVVGNDIFRAQLESLGRVEGSSAPAFLAGWASDRDLADPEIETLEVAAYLTRNQLSTLDKRLADIIDAFRRGGSDPQTFFANLQFLAAQTSTDPDSLGQGDRATIEALLPSFLSKLPYRSQVLQLDQSYWASMSVGQQQEFIEALESRRAFYSDLFGQTEIWADFGAGDPGLEATPVRLVNLP